VRVSKGPRTFPLLRREGQRGPHVYPANLTKEHGEETLRLFAETANVARGDSDFSKEGITQP
jgi:hypothetical protein